MYSGFHVQLSSDDTTVVKFVTPAILEDAIAALVKQQQEQDPKDKFQIAVEWMSGSLQRPCYTVEELKDGETK